MQDLCSSTGTDEDADGLALFLRVAAVLSGVGWSQASTSGPVPHEGSETKRHAGSSRDCWRRSDQGPGTI